MNDSPSCQPLFEELLIKVNARLQEADQWIGDLREIVDRFDHEPVRGGPEPTQLNKGCSTIEQDNSVVGRLRSFNESFTRSNVRLGEVTERFKKLV
jgi:hypothetical protein